jgi:hypothetical protein
MLPDGRTKHNRQFALGPAGYSFAVGHTGGPMPPDGRLPPYGGSGVPGGEKVCHCKRDVDPFRRPTPRLDRTNRQRTTPQISKTANAAAMDAAAIKP